MTPMFTSVNIALESTSVTKVFIIMQWISFQMEADGFKLVKRKNAAKRNIKYNEKRTTEISGNKNVKIDKDEVKLRIHTATVDLTVSEYFNEVLKTVKAAAERVNVDALYCFGLGHFCESVTAKYQFAFLLALKEALEISNSKTFISDPIFYKDEEDVLSEIYGLNVITENLECFVPCQEPSLIILPHCPKQLTNNLLFSNWKPTLIENIIVISNSLTNISESVGNSHVKFINAVVEHNILEEKKLRNSFKFSDIFNDLSLHSFKVRGNVDKEIWEMPRPVYDNADMEFISNKEIT